MRPGVRTGRYRLGKDDMIVDIVGNSHISVEDYAAAMIDELEYRNIIRRDLRLVIDKKSN